MLANHLWLIFYTAPVQFLDRVNPLKIERKIEFVGEEAAGVVIGKVRRDRFATGWRSCECQHARRRRSPGLYRAGRSVRHREAGTGVYEPARGLRPSASKGNRAAILPRFSCG